MLQNSFIRTILSTLLIANLSTTVTFARETAIGRLKNYEAAIVTIKGQQIAVSPEETQSSAIDPATGKMVLLSNRKVSVTENTGAGIVIDPAGIITTNTHIIFGSNIIKVILPDGNELPAQVLFVSPQYDFSILKINAGQPLTAIEWADSDQLALGQEIVTIGHSPLLNRTISGGTVIGMGTRTSQEGNVTPEMIQLNINHYQGDSGGPVFDNKGRFIALLNAKRMLRDRAALAVPANKIHFAYLNLVSPQEKK
ncbi:MAG: trypsin-like peptidase domain-containing protein [Candidatus Omnitrophica bacterium]|nr:trypsin-like peptidase domain-containing protein [Candidatus Omnitrophota bacterium]